MIPQLSPEAEAQREKLREFLGERDPLEIFETTADALLEAVRGASPEELRRRPAEKQWSAVEIIGHLLDDEIITGHRIRVILCEEHPAVPGFDQDLLVEGQRYAERDANELIEKFRQMRLINLPVWRSLTAEQLERYGVHSERGNETLAMMRWMMAGHDLLHIAQIKRHLDAVREGAAA